MWDVRDVGCGMFAGMWDVDLQNAFLTNTKCLSYRSQSIDLQSKSMDWCFILT